MHRPIVSNEPQINATSDLITNGDISAPTKAEVSITETTEVHTPHIDNNPLLLPPRTTSKISREYLNQHISYRAQRLAAKVEPHMVDFVIFYRITF